MSFLSFDPHSISKKDLHQYVIGAVSPRPIALVSSQSEKGNYNLAPYSFFNAFSSSPPIMIFSANLTGQPAKQKDTLRNVTAHRECVINLVSYPIVRQMALCSVEFDADISEFTKSGLTMLDSEIISPPRVKEASVQMECIVQDILALGNEAGAAQLVICRVVRFHVSKEIMDENQRRIDPQKYHTVGRLGRTNYVSVNGDKVFSVYQSVKSEPIGFDGLPEQLLRSKVFTGNDLTRFAALEYLPDRTEIVEYAKKNHLPQHQENDYYHKMAKQKLKNDLPAEAIKIALYEGQ